MADANDAYCKPTFLGSNLPESRFLTTYELAAMQALSRGGSKKPPSGSGCRPLKWHCSLTGNLKDDTGIVSTVQLCRAMEVTGPPHASKWSRR